MKRVYGDELEIVACAPIGRLLDVLEQYREGAETVISVRRPQRAPDKPPNEITNLVVGVAGIWVAGTAWKLDLVNRQGEPGNRFFEAFVPSEGNGGNLRPYVHILEAERLS